MAAGGDASSAGPTTYPWALSTGAKPGTGMAAGPVCSGWSACSAASSSSSSKTGCGEMRPFFGGPAGVVGRILSAGVVGGVEAALAPKESLRLVGGGCHHCGRFATARLSSSESEATSSMMRVTTSPHSVNDMPLNGYSIFGAVIRGVFGGGSVCALNSFFISSRPFPSWPASWAGTAQRRRSLACAA